VSLGIVPGWGGTQLLPRIAGPGTDVTVIVENALNQNRPMRLGIHFRQAVQVCERLCSRYSAPSHHPPRSPA